MAKTTKIGIIPKAGKIVPPPSTPYGGGQIQGKGGRGNAGRGMTMKPGGAPSTDVAQPKGTGLLSGKTKKAKMC